MPMKFVLTSANMSNSILVVCNEENFDNAVKLFSFFLASPRCESALAQLSRHQNVKIDFTRVNLKFQGQWLANNNTIYVKGDLSLQRMLQTFIFELCNANNGDLLPNKMKYSNFATAEEYANYVEMAEHKSFLNAIQLYLEVLSQNSNVLSMPSDVEINQYKQLYGDNTYLSFVKKNGHYDHYVENYNRVMQRRNNFFEPSNENYGKELVVYDPKNSADSHYKF